MCDLGISEAIALAGVATAAAGAGYSAYSSNQAANQERVAQDQAISDQNTGFFARNAAQQQLTQATTGIQTGAIAAESMAGQQAETAEEQALQQRQGIINQANQQTQAETQQAQAVQQQELEDTSAQAMATAQSSDYAKRIGLIQPTVQGIATNTPFGGTTPDPAAPTTPDQALPTAAATSGGSGDADVQQAMAAGRASAAGTVGQYGQDIAAASSYAAPMQQVSNAATNASTQIMPTEVADSLLRASVPTYLAAPSAQYSNAQNLLPAAQQVIAGQAQGAENTAKTAYSGATGVADLTQADYTNLAQTQASEAAAVGQTGASLGQTISGLGNTAALTGGYYGAGGQTPKALSSIWNALSGLAGGTSSNPVLQGGSGAP